MKMTEKEYGIVKIPMELLEEVDKLKGKFGYKTRPEIIKDAIRRLLIDYKRLEAINDGLNL